MIRSAYRHIIWDWNGTLLDDLELSIDVMNAMLVRRQLPLLDRQRYHSLFDFPVQAYYERLGFDPVNDSFSRVSVEFISGYDARRLESKLHDHAPSVLRAVTATGLQQSILSAYRHDTLNEIISHFGLTSHFKQIAGLDNIHARSKVALGRDLVTRLNVSPSEILIVGDTLHDLEVAQELGVDCAVISAGHHPADRLKASGAPVFPDLRAFAAAYSL